MANPFDRNFVKFLTGFVLILTLSFAVLYVVGCYRTSTCFFSKYL